MKFSEFQDSEHINQPHLCLLGHPVSHSVSPIMHNTAAGHYGMDLQYFAIDLQPRDFASIAAHFNRESFRGANITVPYKEMLMEYVDEIDPGARQIGAVNTVLKQGHRLVGSNTDIYGFLKPLEPFEDELAGTRAIIFGTGGASKAVVAGLLDIGLEELILISRTPSKVEKFEKYRQVQVRGYGEWTAYSDEANLVVNTTPLGMKGNEGKSPVRDDEKEFLSGKICYDIVYNPRITRFLEQAEEAGGATVGGLDMLIYQGSESFKKWTGKPFPIEKVRQKLHEYFQE